MERRENRIMAVRDGRNPYGSRGGYVTSRRSRRGRRGDRGMDYEGQDMRGSGSQYSMRRYRDMGDYENQDMRRGDRAGQDYADMRMDGHHYPQGQGATYYPVQAMGTFEGYYGMPEQDYGYDMRGRGRDYGYDMRGRGSRMDYARGRDYGDYDDYGDDYGDYGETLSEEELEKWCKKLKSKLSEQEKQMFSKEAIAQKAKAMNKQMEGFGEKELEVVTLMLLDDYKKSLGVNPDLMIKLAFDWLNDEDASLKGAEKLAVYYDEIVMGGEQE